MRFVVFGLTVSSSWGNGHATLWRGLCRALHARGHHVTFFERDVTYYAAHRDVERLPGGALHLYSSWPDAYIAARKALRGADVGMVTSYCPDGCAATRLILDSNVGVSVFYDMDTPITLAALQQGRRVEYLPPDGLTGFDLVLSYTGGRALDALRTDLGARRVAPLYGSVDPDTHRPAQPVARYRADLSWLGTFAQDRQAALETLLIEPARRLPQRRFLVGGAQYPEHFPWSANIWFVRHVAPAEHPAFFSSSRATLNVTRAAMADMGYCPSGRLFEAAACATPVVSDAWEGLHTFFTPSHEIFVARTGDDVAAVLQRSDAELQRIGRAARERALTDHTAARRAEQLERLVSERATISIDTAVPPAARLTTG